MHSRGNGSEQTMRQAAGRKEAWLVGCRLFGDCCVAVVARGDVLLTKVVLRQNGAAGHGRASSQPGDTGAVRCC